MELVSARIVQQGNNYHAIHGDDSGLFVEFYMEAVKDEEASVKEGRPIFRDREFIKIHIAGDKTRVTVRPIRLERDGREPSDPERFPRQWQAFKNKEFQPLEGTPITEWAPVTKSMAMELKAMNIHTVEALASVSDVNLNWMGARALRDQAKIWLEKAKGGSDVSRVMAENEQLKIDIEAMKQQIAAMANGKRKKGKEDGEESA